MVIKASTRLTLLAAGCFLFGSIVVDAPAANAAERPDSFAKLSAEKLPAVVNISTKQKIEEREKPERPGAMPQPMPGPGGPGGPGSPLEEFFKEFFGNRPGGPMQPTPRQL